MMFRAGEKGRPEATDKLQLFLRAEENRRRF